jgi:hypothetical protein
MDVDLREVLGINLKEISNEALIVKNCHQTLI